MIRVGKGERTLLFAKAKSSKSFLNFALQNREWILRFEILGFYGIVESKGNHRILREILRNCRIAGGFESLISMGILLLAKAKSSKSFFWILRCRIWEGGGNHRIYEVDSVILWILR